MRSRDELHYAQKMTSYLSTLNPSAPELLQLAIRAQHLRRWGAPKRQLSPPPQPNTRSQHRSARPAQPVASAGPPATSGALVRKADLKQGDPDTQTLEDVACLVFLDDQFETKDHPLNAIPTNFFALSDN
jgi:hypothetical protein